MEEAICEKTPSSCAKLAADRLLWKGLILGAKHHSDELCQINRIHQRTKRSQQKKNSDFKPWHIDLSGKTTKECICQCQQWHTVVKFCF